MDQRVNVEFCVKLQKCVRNQTPVCGVEIEAGFDAVGYRKIAFPCLKSNPIRPTHSQSLHRLSNPGSFHSSKSLFKDFL
jgi:hypothetical protein